MTEAQAYEHADLITELDLGQPDDRTDLIDRLQERRAFHLQVLTTSDGTIGPTAGVLAIRATRWAEVERIEAVLTAMSVPFEAPEEQP